MRHSTVRGVPFGYRHARRRSHNVGPAEGCPPMTVSADEPVPEHTFLERILDGIERLGNKMPDPAILFLILCGVVIVLSQILYWFDFKATFEVVKPPPAAAEQTYYGGSVEPTYVGPTEPEAPGEYKVVTETAKVKGLLTGEGVRYLFTSFVSNFRNFAAVAIILVVMIGVGLAEACRADSRPDTKARRRLVAQHADIRHRAARDHLEHRLRRRLSGADTARSRGVQERRPKSVGRNRSRLRRRRRRLRRELPHHAARRRADGDHQRRERQRRATTSISRRTSTSASARRSSSRSS